MSSMDFDVDTAIEVLERTPATLRSMLGGISAEWLDATEGPDTFSPYVVVGHLIHGERTDWLTRTQIILAQGDNKRFEVYDRFAQYRESEGNSLAQLLDEFEQLRAENLSALGSFDIDDGKLSLEGEHPKFGPVTLRQLLAAWVVHDLGHIAQCARVMAKQYKEAIGPWAEYLPIVTR